MDTKKKKNLQSLVLLCTMLFSMFLVLSSSPAIAQDQPLLSFTCTVPVGYDREYAAMLVIKDSLAKNGIEMNLVREEATFFSKVWGTDTYRLTYEEGGEDSWSYWWYWRPEDLIYFSSFTPRGFPPEGWNEWSINNAVIDEMLTAATSVYDVAQRKQYYDKFTEEWQRDIPFIPLYYVEGCKLANANLENYYQILQTANAKDWKIKGKTYDDFTTIRLAVPFTDNYLDPLWGNTGTSSGWACIAPAWPMLLKEQRQPDGTWAMVPDMAESYEVSDDGLTLTFQLRKDAYWSDGVPFTAEDVKVSYEGILDPTTGVPALADIKGITKIETPDDHTAIFTLNKPNSLIITAISGFCVAGIVPAHIFGKIPHAEWRGYWSDPGQIVNLGAYKIAEFVPNERYVLEVNPNYWGEKPFVDRIEVVVVPEIATALAALQKGEIDVIGLEYNSGPEIIAALPELEKNPNVDVSWSSNSGTAYFGLNLNHPILGNRYVRMAIASLIPIDTIINDVLKGHAKAANGPIEYTSPFYNPDFPPICQYNPEKAREYLTKAGYTPKVSGVPMTFYAYPVIALVVGLAIGAGVGYLRKKPAAK